MKNTGKKPFSKSRLIKELSWSCQLPQTQVSAILETLVVIARREAPNTFVLPGICKLEVVRRKPRKMRNPRTGESFMLPERDALRITAPRSLKLACAKVIAPAPAAAPAEAPAPAPAAQAPAEPAAAPTPVITSTPVAAPAPVAAPTEAAVLAPTEPAPVVESAEAALVETVAAPVEQPVETAAEAVPVEPAAEAAPAEAVAEAAIEQPVEEAAVEQPVEAAVEPVAEATAAEAAIEQPVEEAAVEQPVEAAVEPAAEAEAAEVPAEAPEQPVEAAEEAPAEEVPAEEALTEQPVEAAEAAEEAPVEQAEEAEEAAGPAPVIDPNILISFRCPRCQQEVEATGDLIGFETECPTCGNPMMVPAESEPGTIHAPGNNGEDDGLVRHAQTVSTREAESISPEKLKGLTIRIDVGSLGLDTPQPEEEAKEEPQPDQMISFICSACSQEIEASRDMIGETTVCPACGAPITVPAESAANTLHDDSQEKDPKVLKAMKGRTMRIDLGDDF